MLHNTCWEESILCVTVLVCGRWPVSPVFCLSRELDRRLVVLVDSVICAS